MKIIIATGVYPPDVGGPAQYAKNLKDKFSKKNHEVGVFFYKIEKKLPPIVRHVFYFFRIFFQVRSADFVIALDTFSVGLPAVCAAKIWRKRIVLRVSGDFLWETYINRGGKLITLSDFNKQTPVLSLKEKLIYSLQGFTIRSSTALAFNTVWQKKIFEDKYDLKTEKNFVVENYYTKRESWKSGTGNKKIFLWAGRPIRLKNLDLLKKVFLEIKSDNEEVELKMVSKLSYNDLLEEIKKSYAVILPSISDVYPNFILDAVSLGKPFIMTRETGQLDRFGDIGIFVDPLDKESIKQKILFLLDNNNYEEYKNRVAQFDYSHSWEQIAEEFLDIYHNI